MKYTKFSSPLKIVSSNNLESIIGKYSKSSKKEYAIIPIQLKNYNTDITDNIGKYKNVFVVGYHCSQGQNDKTLFKSERYALLKYMWKLYNKDGMNINNYNSLFKCSEFMNLFIYKTNISKADYIIVIG